MNGTIYEIELYGDIFPVLTTEKYRAYQFFIKVFPEENIILDIIKIKHTIFSKECLREAMATVRATWKQLDLLNATAGTIKFDRPALDNLLEYTNKLLTNL